jgi:phosphate transport system permease protein
MKAPDSNIPERFRVARPTLLFDRFMTHFIKLGGLSVIVAVALIFVFILIQVIPIFRGASVKDSGRSIALPVPDGEKIVAMGSDEWFELPFFVTDKGRIFFQDTVEGEHNRGWFEAETKLPKDVPVTAIRYNQRSDDIVFGLADGRFTVARVRLPATFPQRGGREVVPELSWLPLIQIGEPGHPITKIDYGSADTRKLALAVQTIDGAPRVTAVTLAQRRTLLGAGPLTVGERYDVTALLDGKPVALRVPWEADSALIATDHGTIEFFTYEGGFRKRQSFKPFASQEDVTISSMDYVLGDVSVVVTNPQGVMRVWSLYRDPESNQRLFGETKRFPDLPTGGSTFHSISVRNKAFLSGAQSFATLRYMTTENIRWEGTLPFNISLAKITPRYDQILFLDTTNRLHFYILDDHHPVAGWKTYFGRIQYEGQAKPTWTWQSTGGRDDFEKKLSLVPLIIGTLKGTFYAMIFAVPIALLGAIYTSQFLQPSFKRFVKPTMEIMASLPSVVLGFLAALWLAPIISNAVPSVVLALSFMIALAFGLGAFWSRLPNRFKLLIKPGYEFLAIIPAAIVFAWIGWSLGPVVEKTFFVVTDPITGITAPDFRFWFSQTTGLPFEQRNAFVVGFVMGFAVIPIIFTISEDAMSNVPQSFRSGSLALGASRWQTAIRIVLPTAFAGIFSALMIGLGRAVGETMIVVMATGNVAVNDFNPFTGMRTLSANIAVELPEAPYLGTLYRTLFLSALILFLLTFIVNTVAEILRQRLRERFRAVE